MWARLGWTSKEWFRTASPEPSAVGSRPAVVPSFFRIRGEANDRRRPPPRHSCQPWKLRSRTSAQFVFGACNQFGRLHVERVGEHEQGAKRRRVLGAFEEADVGRVQLARGAEGLLGESPRPSCLAQHAPERFVQPLGSACRSLGHGPDCCGPARDHSTEYVLTFTGEWLVCLRQGAGPRKQPWPATELTTRRNDLRGGLVPSEIRRGLTPLLPRITVRAAA